MDNIVSMDSLIAEEEVNNENVIKDKKIERIQIGLIIVLIVVGTLVYFFGYDYLKPFIRVD